MKTCRKCKVEKDESEYYLMRARCKSCVKARVRAYAAANADAVSATKRKHYLSHKANVKETTAKYYLNHREECNERNAGWFLDHPRTTAFIKQRASAKQRGIEFLLTKDEWIDFWGDSFDLRGKGPDDLQMCRYGDDGSYELGNIYMASASENQSRPRKLPVPEW